MRRLGAGAAVVVVVLVLVLVLRPSHRVARSNQPVKLTTPHTGPTPSAGSSKASGTYTGAVVPTQYGPVQVAIAVTAGRITDIKALQYPVDRPRSQSINSQAIPLLRSEVLTAQSARIDLISGASFTSDAFATSLQSAISQEG